VTDWIEWLNLGLGVAGTSGILVLVRQWYIDTLSKHPYSGRLPWKVRRGIPPRGVFLQIELTNRRSRSASISVGLGFYGRTTLNPEVSCNYSIPSVEKLTGSQSPAVGRLELEPHGTDTFIVRAEVPAYSEWPKTARLSLGDLRGWSWVRELDVPSPPTAGTNDGPMPLGLTF